MSDDLDLLREATKASVETAMRRGQQQVQIPGRVQDYDPQSGLAAVLLDGDPTDLDADNNIVGVTYGVPNLSGSWPHPGERVMCTFVPPQGLFVTAVFRNVGPPHYTWRSFIPTPLAAGTPAILNGPSSVNDLWTGGREQYFESPPASYTAFGEMVLYRAWYRITAKVEMTSAAAGRRFVGIVLNGTINGLTLYDSRQEGTGTTTIGGSADVRLDTNDVIQVRALCGVAASAELRELSIDWLDSWSGADEGM